MLFFVLGGVLLASPVNAAKLLPRFKTGGKVVKKGVASGIAVSARLRTDRKALNVYFNNLKAAQSVSYTLIYQTNGRDEGVRGSIDSSSGNSGQRELLFGTCSAGVCRYHTNIANMRLEVVSELVSGKKLLKRFRIRV